MNHVVAAGTATHATTGALTYIIRQDEKPYFLSSALTGGEPEVHFKTELHTVAINDMRTIAATS